jgi:hypothetical protein
LKIKYGNFKIVLSLKIEVAEGFPAVQVPDLVPVYPNNSIKSLADKQKMHFFARFLLILGAVLVLQLTSVGADSAEICKWLGDHNGHYCDSAAERWIWRKWNFLKSGATDCNSFCANNPKKNFKGGHCKSAANYDTSSWCGKGQVCICY